MSQERKGKSPSRIPVFSAQRKRPASALPTGSNQASSSTTTPKTPSMMRIERLNNVLMADASARVEERSRGRPITRHGGSVSGVPWVEKHLPQVLDELFVHKKKVEEVLSWLERSFSSMRRNKICVLSGPAGCGKTATISLIAKQLEADVKEFVNPMSLSDRAYVPGEYQATRDEVQGRSELDLFKDFLQINSHYRMLPINGKKMKKNRVILIEDIPTALYKDPNAFHEILRNFAKTDTFPLVFVVTDTVNSDHSMYKMFPKSLMTELSICNISFNPVAASLMVKFLLDICHKESKPVDKSQVEDIAAASNGDLRCAVNNLQFFLTNARVTSSALGGFRKPQPPKRSRKSQPRQLTAAAEVQQKDDTIQLFKALGKVLYAKRDETTVKDVEMELQGNMESARRIHPLIEDPDNIAMKIEVSSDTFLGFLHQNYPSFYGSMDDLYVAAEYLSTSEFILSGWKFDDSGTRSFKVRDTKEQVSMNIAIRGLMHSNSNRISSGWKPLTKPLFSNFTNNMRDSVESTRQSLYHLRELQTTLFTEAIPFYAKLLQLKPTCMIDSRKEILDKGLFKSHSFRTESLDEKETIEDNVNDAEEDSDEAKVQRDDRIVARDLATNSDNIKDDTEEEFLIEEYAD